MSKLLAKMIWFCSGDIVNILNRLFLCSFLHRLRHFFWKYYGNLWATTLEPKNQSKWILLACSFRFRQCYFLFRPQKFLKENYLVHLVKDYSTATWVYMPFTCYLTHLIIKVCERKANTKSWTEMNNHTGEEKSWRLQMVLSRILECWEKIRFGCEWQKTQSNVN